MPVSEGETMSNRKRPPVVVFIIPLWEVPSFEEIAAAEAKMKTESKKP